MLVFNWQAAFGAESTPFVQVTMRPPVATKPEAQPSEHDVPELIVKGQLPVVFGNDTVA